jgi:hypothetical protein
MLTGVQSARALLVDADRNGIDLLIQGLRLQHFDVKLPTEDGGCLSIDISEDDTMNTGLLVDTGSGYQMLAPRRALDSLIDSLTFLRSITPEYHIHIEPMLGFPLDESSLGLIISIRPDGFAGHHSKVQTGPGIPTGPRTNPDMEADGSVDAYIERLGPQ